MMSTTLMNGENKKIKLTLLIFFLFFFIGVIKIKADTSNNVTGWLWSGSEEISDGDQNNGNSGTETAVGWINTNNTNTGGAVSYGLNIPQNGIISGRAWSENIGFVSFDAADTLGCPIPDPTDGCSAHSHGNNYLTGWARIIAICDGNGDGKCDNGETNSNSGGWKGWINLSGTAQNGSFYGVLMNSSGLLSGYAWSDELGAIKFNTLNGATVSIPSVTLTPDRQLIALTVGQSLNSLSMAEKTVNISWETHGVINSCVLSCTGACDSSWAGITTGTSKSIVIQGQDGMYEIKCYDGANGTGNLIAQDLKNIIVGCYGNSCQTNLCSANSTFIPTDDYAICASEPNSTCSHNQDCILRTINVWKEIAP